MEQLIAVRNDPEDDLCKAAQTAAIMRDGWSWRHLAPDWKADPLIDTAVPPLTEPLAGVTHRRSRASPQRRRSRAASPIVVRGRHPPGGTVATARGGEGLPQSLSGGWPTSRGGW